jgi:hypothetical protein
MVRTVLCFTAMLGALLSCVSASAAAPVSDADILTERLLWAVGGREPWASLNSTAVHSQQYMRGDPTAITALTNTDFQQRRYRIDTTAQSQHAVGAVVGAGDRHWRLDSRGRTEQGAATALAQDLRWYTVHIYQILQRLAARDPALTVAVSRNDRLEVREGATRIAWYLLDARGEPYSIGAYNDDVGVICGPWDIETNGIRYPAWVSRPDGSWRTSLKSLAVNATIDEALFEQALAGDQ